MKAPSGEWKSILAAVFTALAATGWILIYMKKCGTYFFFLLFKETTPPHPHPQSALPHSLHLRCRVCTVPERVWKSLKFESPFSGPWKSVKNRCTTWTSLEIVFWQWLCLSPILLFLMHKSWTEKCGFFPHTHAAPASLLLPPAWVQWRLVLLTVVYFFLDSEVNVIRSLEMAKLGSWMFLKVLEILYCKICSKTALNIASLLANGPTWGRGLWLILLKLWNIHDQVWHFPAEAHLFFLSNLCSCNWDQISHRICCCFHLGSGDSLAVRVPDSWSKGHRFEEWWENLLLQGQLSVMTVVSGSVPPLWYSSSM